jgi:hypothetical protein
MKRSYLVLMVVLMFVVFLGACATMENGTPKTPDEQKVEFLNKAYKSLASGKAVYMSAWPSFVSEYKAGRVGEADYQLGLSMAKEFHAAYLSAATKINDFRKSPSTDFSALDPVIVDLGLMAAGFAAHIGARIADDD